MTSHRLCQEARFTAASVCGLGPRVAVYAIFRCFGPFCPTRQVRRHYHCGHGARPKTIPGRHPLATAQLAVSDHAVAAGAPAHDAEAALRFKGVVRRMESTSRSTISTSRWRAVRRSRCSPERGGQVDDDVPPPRLLRPTRGPSKCSARHAQRGGPGPGRAMLQTGSGSGLPPGVKVSEALALVRRLYRRPRTSTRPSSVPASARSCASDQPAVRGEAQRVRFALAIAGDPSSCSWTSRRSPWTSTAGAPSGR